MAVKPDCLKDLHVPNFYIEGSRITEVKTKDHLGYIITEDFADDQPINKEIRSVYTQGNMLDRKFKFCSDEKLRGDFLYLTVQVYIVVRYDVALALKLSLSLKLLTTIFLGSSTNYKEDQVQVFLITLLQWIYLTSTLLEKDWYIQFVS